MTSDTANVGPAPGPSAPGFRFGRFELHPSRRELLLDGQPIELQPKVFELIAYLLAHRDRAVEKNELLDAVWPRQVVTDAALSRCVMKARRALLDDAANPTVILTVHGRGFRFVAPVTLAKVPAPEAIGGVPARRASDTPAVAAPIAAAPPIAVAPPIAAAPPIAVAPATAVAPAIAVPAPPPVPPASPIRRWWPLLAMVTLLLAVFGAWRWQQSGAPAVDGPARVAVLPFNNGTKDPRHDWARLGLAQGVNDLLGAHGANAVDPGAVMDIEDGLSGLDARTREARLRAALGATHVVRGTLQASGGKMQVEYTLIGPDGRTRQRTVIADRVPALVRAVAADLGVQLGLARHSGLRLDDEFGNEAFLRGRSLGMQGEWKQALPYFRLAAEQVPGNPWPRLELARSQHELGEDRQAQVTLEALLGEADAGGEIRLRRAVRGALAAVLSRPGDKARAEKLLLESTVLAEADPAPDAVAPDLMRLAGLATDRKDFKGAHAFLDRAEKAQRRAGLPGASGELLDARARLALREGDLANAGRHLEAAQARFRLVGNRRSEALALSALGKLRRTQGRLEEARDLVARALEVHRKAGDRHGEASTMLELGGAEAELGRLTIAIGLVRDARFLAEEIGERPLVGEAHALLGQLFMDVGDLRRARRQLEVSLASSEAVGDAGLVRQQRFQLARLAGREDDPAKSRRECEALLREPGTAADRELRVQVLRHLAGLSLAAGDSAGAARELAQARRLADQSDDARLRARVHLDLAELALSLHDPVRAGQELDAAEPALAGESAFLLAKARLREASGESREALRLEQAAKLAAGERWRPEDEARLAAHLLESR